MRNFILLAVLVLVLGGFMYSSVGLDGFFHEKPSVEVGVYTTSPAGVEAGRAVPASGCSDLHDSDCDAPIITANPVVVRRGDPVQICWNPDNHTSCNLSSNVTGNANAIACATVNPTSNATYSISCTDGVPATATVNVYVLPEVYES